MSPLRRRFVPWVGTTFFGAFCLGTCILCNLSQNTLTWSDSCFIITAFSVASDLGARNADSDSAKRRVSRLHSDAFNSELLRRSVNCFRTKNNNTMKRVMWYFEEGDVVLWRRLCDTLNRVMGFFEDGCVVLWRAWCVTLKRLCLSCLSYFNQFHSIFIRGKSIVSQHRTHSF